MRCTNCGKENENNFKYCRFCGTKLAGASNEDKGEGSVDKYFKGKKHEERELIDQGIKNGWAWLLVGIAITGGTYLFTEPGGTYFILWGPMIYGAYKLLKGYSDKSRMSK